MHAAKQIPFFSCKQKNKKSCIFTYRFYIQFLYLLVSNYFVFQDRKKNNNNNNNTVYNRNKRVQRLLKEKKKKQSETQGCLGGERVQF